MGHAQAAKPCCTALPHHPAFDLVRWAAANPGTRAAMAPEGTFQFQRQPPPRPLQPLQAYQCNAYPG